jgi:hypothetical protein
MDYETTANELSKRIEALMPDNPQVRTMTDPWQLFKVPGFKCDYLQPSLAQAACALGAAQGRYNQRHGN